MDIGILSKVVLLNSWLENGDYTSLLPPSFQPRKQLFKLLDAAWDDYCTILIGPRQAGKTTLGRVLSYKLIVEEQRFEKLIYLNCDIKEIRGWVTDITFIEDIKREFSCTKAIIFIDEVQRLEQPGLLLKSIIDLKTSHRIIASGSSQLELKSKIKEHLTGRKIEATVLPLSLQEYKPESISDWLLYGCYPKVLLSKEKRLILEMLYNEYISKDIIEILKLGKPDVLEKLLTLIAHGSGQQVNEQQLSIDCRVSNTTIRNYLDVLEHTFVIKKITPFVGNKRTEITSTPKYYFIDNGFRNQALHNFLPLDNRSDFGLLAEGAVFQEILKFKYQNYLDFDIKFWRTKSNAEVDFVLTYNNNIIPIEAKQRSYNRFTLARGFRSFIDAYNIKNAFVVTKNYSTIEYVNDCRVMMLPITQLDTMFSDFLDIVGID